MATYNLRKSDDIYYMNHYTYKITNIKTNKSYIGVRSCEDTPSEDIGIKYFSSSSDKVFISEQRINPENFIYEVINTFDNRVDALTDEIRLHEMHDVCKNPQFYNLSKQTSNGMDFTGGNHSEESKLKIGEASKERGISEKAKANLLWHTKNRIRTPEEIKKMSEAKLGNTNASGKRSEEYSKKLSERMQGTAFFKGRTHSDEAKKKMSEAKLGNTNASGKRSEEHRKRISEGRKGKGTGPAPIVKCPHCEKEGGLYAMKQWHFNNCRYINKNKEDINVNL